MVNRRLKCAESAERVGCAGGVDRGGGAVRVVCLADGLFVLNAPLPGLRLADLVKSHSLLGGVVNINVCDLRNKVLGLPRLVDGAVELVDLFERKTLGLVNHEPTAAVSVHVHRELRTVGTYTNAIQTKQKDPQTKKTLL